MKEDLWDCALNPTTAKIVFESTNKIRKKIGFDCEAKEWEALKADKFQKKYIPKVNDGKWRFLTVNMVRRKEAFKANDIPVGDGLIEDYPFMPTLSFLESA